jgi:hypothetical protein
VSAQEGDEKATVSAVTVGSDGSKEAKRQVPLNLRAVVMTIGEMGGNYSDAVEMIRKSNEVKIVNSSLAIDSVPRGMPITQLARLARTDSNLEQANVFVTQVTANTSGLQQVSFELPVDETQKTKPVEEQPLNRSPGRIFSGKKHPQEAEPEAPPASRLLGSEADFARSPGRIFGK